MCLSFEINLFLHDFHSDDTFPGRILCDTSFPDITSGSTHSAPGQGVVQFLHYIITNFSLVAGEPSEAFWSCAYLLLLKEISPPDLASVDNSCLNPALLQRLQNEDILLLAASPFLPVSSQHSTRGTFPPLTISFYIYYFPIPLSPQWFIILSSCDIFLSFLYFLA